MAQIVKFFNTRKGATRKRARKSFRINGYGGLDISRKRQHYLPVFDINHRNDARGPMIWPARGSASEGTATACSMGNSSPASVIDAA